jgi:hypothetical protein
MRDWYSDRHGPLDPGARRDLRDGAAWLDGAPRGRGERAPICVAPIPRVARRTARAGAGAAAREGNRRAPRRP